MTDLRRVLIVGAGGIGQQIAGSCAARGLAVTLYDIDPATLESSAAACRRQIEAARAANPAQRGLLDAALADLRATADPHEAGRDADLLIESVPEQLPLKRQVFALFAGICPPHTIFTTNTSVFLTSMFIKPSGRPDRLAALHFARESDLVEIMPHSRTSPETTQRLVEFARRIGHLAIVLQREQPGHLVNTMLMSLNNAALTLAANGVADPHDIDRAWMKATHEKRGPFGLLDLVGLKTALGIAEYGARVSGSAQAKKNAAYLQSAIDEGRLGKDFGRGFYRYPHPEFEQLGFLHETPTRSASEAETTPTRSASEDA